MDRSDNGKEKEVWRLELEGKAERNGVEGVSVNPEGESRHGQVRAKIERKERENHTKMEEKVDGKSPSDEGAKIQSPKRKVIRVESEETQGLCERIIELEPG